MFADRVAAWATDTTEPGITQDQEGRLLVTVGEDSRMTCPQELSWERAVEKAKARNKQGESTDT